MRIPIKIWHISLCAFLMISTNCFSQKKYQYIRIYAYATKKNSTEINYGIDTAGLNNALKIQLQDYVTNTHHYHSYNQLFNTLGN